MKTLIVYSTRTGNTKKLAEMTQDLLAGEKELCSIEEAPEPNGYDLVVLGFWLQAGKPDPESAAYLKKINSGKLFLIATHGAAPDSPHAVNAMDHAASLVAGAQIAGTFNCQGEVDPAFLETARKKDPLPPWIKDADAAIGHPNQSDRQRLAETMKLCLPGLLP